MTDLADRYGTGRARRRGPLVLAGVVVAVFGSWLAWSTWSYATPQVRSELLVWEVTDQHEVTARVEVRVAVAGVVASCLLRAYAEDHSVVGEQAFEVRGQDGPDAARATEVEVLVRTERLANAVEHVGCRTPDQAQPR